MIADTINLMRPIVASWWRYLLFCWRWRKVIAALLEEFDRACARVQALESSQSASVLELIDARQAAEARVVQSKAERAGALAENEWLRKALSEAAAAHGRSKSENEGLAEARAEHAESDRAKAISECENLRSKISALEDKHAREKGGNKVLLQFIQANHRPHAIR